MLSLLLLPLLHDAAAAVSEWDGVPVSAIVRAGGAIDVVPRLDHAALLAAGRWAEAEAVQLQRVGARVEPPNVVCKRWLQRLPRL